MGQQVYSLLSKLVILLFTPFIWQASAGSLNCTFDVGFCDWTSDKDDDFDWQRGKGVYRVSAPESDHTTGYGYYIFIYAFNQQEGDRARITSSVQTPGAHCLTLWYYMNSRYLGALNTYVKTVNGKEILIFTKDTDIRSWRWQKAVISLKTNVEFQVVLEDVRIGSNLSYTRVDDIFMTDGLCTVECDFEFGFCHWVQDVSDDFDWSRHRGGTSTPNTGPRGDHTSGHGFYIYIDTSKARKNTSARLLCPWLREGKYCFSFWYYMYGRKVETLTVQKVDVNKITSEIVEITGQQQQQWIQENALIHATSGNGKKNGYYDYGEIAIDDVQMLSCQDCADPTPEYGKTNSNNFIYKAIVQITCNSGYTIKGDNTIVCEPEGIWSGSPTCEPVDCLIPKIANGKMSGPRNNTTYSQTVDIACEDGYDLIGKKNITCQADGNWSALPACDLRQSTNTSALTAVYVTVPLVAVALVIVLIAIIWRKRILEYCAIRSSHGRARKEQPQPKTLFTNMAYSENFNENQEGDISQDDEYAVIADDRNQTGHDENPAYYNIAERVVTTIKETEHIYNHATKPGTPVTDNTYSHLAGDIGMSSSTYNTTAFPLSGNALFQAKTNLENKTYDVLNTKIAKQGCGIDVAPDVKDDQESVYDHARAGGTDPTDIDDYTETRL